MIFNCSHNLSQYNGYDSENCTRTETAKLIVYSIKSRHQNTVVTLFSGRIATRRPDGAVDYDLKATMGRKKEREMKSFLLSVSSPVNNPSHAFLFNVEESKQETENREK